MYNMLCGYLSYQRIFGMTNMKYKIQTAEFELRCRVKKRSLVCKNSYVYIQFGYGDSIYLEECRILTGRTYGDVLEPAFTEWVHSILHAACTMAFFCFPNAQNIQMEYVWTLEYSQVETGIPWSIGYQTLGSHEIHALKGNILWDEDDKIEEDWSLPEWDPSPHQVVLIYS